MKNNLPFEYGAHPYISTYSGKVIQYGDWEVLAKNHYYVPDIAVSLSRSCRFVGQSRRFYSVAEHSVLVSYLVRPELAMHALLHDASEAYMADLPRPLKYLPELHGYRHMEKQMQQQIYSQICGTVPDEEDEADIKNADTYMLSVEGTHLMANPNDYSSVPDLDTFGLRIECYSPEDAAVLFIGRYCDLRNESLTLVLR